MHRQVGTVVFLFLGQADADRHLEYAIHQETTQQRHHHAQRGADKLAGQADAAQATERLLTEDATGDAAPHATQAVQRPDAEHTATRPANGPLCRKPGSLRPTSKAATVPPTIAIRVLTATRPLTLPRVCALITLKPNQPMIRIHEPSARNGIFDGAKATKRPSR